MDLDALQTFANNNDFGVTQPLTHAQVSALAEHWLPQIRFHHDERYHPISLQQAIEMVVSDFGAMSEPTRASFRVRKLVKSGSTATAEFFDPPLVTAPDGPAPLASSPGIFVSTVQVLTDGATPLEALGAAKVGKDARVTHGGSERRSRRFFGAAATVGGSDVPAPGDPLVPRAQNAAGTAAEITVMASWKNLLETLKFNLLTRATDGYPPDAMRKGFKVDRQILRPTNALVNTEQLEALLLEMIRAHESGDDLPTLPPGVMFDRKAWDALTRYAFLEFALYYAYNDFERYQSPAIFDNEHEGDDEGFCLVFDRNLINLAVSTGNPGDLLLVPPHSIITSVHEEYQGADCARVFPTASTPFANAEELRDSLELVVWIAGGSHATYLSSGEHDLVDFGDYLGWINENAAWLFLAPPVVLAVAIVLHVIEHFIDTKDFTSDDGVHAGPGSDRSNSQTVAHRIVTLPMSTGNHVYNDRALLTPLAYPGFWGDHDGPIDASAPFIPKTGRFFRKFVEIV